MSDTARRDRHHMADLDTAGAVSLGLAVLAGVVAAVEKLSGVRRDWRGRRMPPKKQHAAAADSVAPSSDDAAPVTRRGRPSLTTLSEQLPVTRAEFEARISALDDRVSELKQDVDELDRWKDRFEVEMVRGVGGINTRLETLRGRIASLYDMVTRTGRRR